MKYTHFAQEPKSLTSEVGNLGLTQELVAAVQEFAIPPYFGNEEVAKKEICELC